MRKFWKVINSQIGKVFNAHNNKNLTNMSAEELNNFLLPKAQKQFEI